MSAVLPASAMRRVTCAELKNLAAAYRPALCYAAAQCARETKIYLHWTAGHYGQFFADYHVQIDADGGIYVIGDGALNALLAATYRRNSGSVSVAVLGACGATTEHLGAEPPTAVQIEAMAMAVTTLADGLWLTIDKARILTHGEAADNEDGVHAHAPYGPRTTCERWDLEYLGTAESPAFHPWAEDGKERHSGIGSEGADAPSRPMESRVKRGAEAKKADSEDDLPSAFFFRECGSLCRQIHRILLDKK